MEGALPEKNTQSIVGSFAKQHNLAPSDITTNFSQIEPNITIVDNTHAIESVTLGTKDILELDELEVVAMATNKEGLAYVCFKRFCQ
jgi:hypothetical protein